MQMNYYEVLGCDKESSHEEIKRAYRARLLRFHPDKSDTSKRDAREFHEVQQAWSVLGHPQSRREYDAACKQEELEKENELVYARLASDELEEDAFGNELFYRCRCGDRYFVQRKDLCLRNTVLQVICESCTLVILVET
ncbi:dnaJ homolog subfamily C member 24 [Harpegnathos saltator]|uniref:DnaJ-like protein subfamily C member 24 n=1 Tax=Harpegnathos saltator TaxID=610380 RepID=E2B5B5_HARSA|nr:dnaJ homolog subfamily C member 24 [Harpegnathos saltator]EFN89110.1 DnaJ-like protein subfamily C member 24 [Harpegnathos saltator]